MANEATSEVGNVVSRDLLHKLTKYEIAELARVTYGLNVSPEHYPKEELIDFIMNAARKFKGNAEMRVVNMNEEVEVPPDYVKIRVSPGEHNPKNRPIPVGLNFTMATIPVNKDVVMHKKWLPCLQDAVERKYTVGPSADGTKEELVWNDQHRYPFSILERG